LVHLEKGKKDPWCPLEEVKPNLLMKGGSRNTSNPHIPILYYLLFQARA
jgi:hypothetical protein